MTTKESRAQFIDILYEMRQDGELQISTLKTLLRDGCVSEYTYNLIRRLPIK